MDAKHNTAVTIYALAVEKNNRADAALTAAHAAVTKAAQFAWEACNALDDARVALLESAIRAAGV